MKSDGLNSNQMLKLKKVERWGERLNKGRTENRADWAAKRKKKCINITEKEYNIN